MRNLYDYLTRTSLLLTGALVGLALGACDLGPKKIGAETMGDVPMCEEGEEKLAEDGCNTCTCTEGSWGCTKLGCEAPAECEEGEKKPAEDGCNTCFCADGEWSCTKLACEEPPAECTDGEEKPVGDGCNTCTCFEGNWACTLKACLPDECEPGEQKMEDCNACVCLEDGSWGCDAQQCPDPVCVGSGTLAIDGAAVVGDELVVDVTYSGGCEVHEIGMCWDGFFAESFPVQAWVDLSHEGPEDLCKALVQEQRKLDLGGMKASYQAGYQVENGTIVIHLKGWQQGTLEYQF